MQMLFTRLALAMAPLLLGGCCYFAPCHPGTRIAGTVTDAVSHQPIAGAAVRLYHYETKTSQSGCFALGGADALPFEFGVSSPGYKPALIKPVPGFYSAAVALVPDSDSGTSSAEIHEISHELYAELSSNCH